MRASAAAAVKEATTLPSPAAKLQPKVAHSVRASAVAAMEETTTVLPSMAARSQPRAAVAVRASAADFKVPVAMLRFPVTHR